MARKDGRSNAHIQEKRPPSGGGLSSPAPPAEERPAVEEGRQPGWRWAATAWAIVFLFLTALMLFDLVAGLFH
jgi:hypothetical protein